MIVEMTAEELEASCPTFIAVKAKDMTKAKSLLNRKYLKVLQHQLYAYLTLALFPLF